MTERRLPIPACSSICRNAYNEVCIEECSPKRDCSSFELRKDLELPTMPQYPETKGLTWKERFVIEEAYLKKAVDFIQGRKVFANERTPNFPRRPRSFSPSNHERDQGEEQSNSGSDPDGVCKRSFLGYLPGDGNPERIESQSPQDHEVPDETLQG